MPSRALAKQCFEGWCKFSLQTQALHLVLEGAGVQENAQQTERLQPKLHLAQPASNVPGRIFSHEVQDPGGFLAEWGHLSGATASVNYMGFSDDTWTGLM